MDQEHHIYEYKYLVEVPKEYARSVARALDLAGLKSIPAEEDDSRPGIDRTYVTIALFVPLELESTLTRLSDTLTQHLGGTSWKAAVDSVSLEPLISNTRALGERMIKGLVTAALPDDVPFEFTELIQYS
jgi:hypothetical protein